jgi:hypothetical protein
MAVARQTLIFARAKDAVCYPQRRLILTVPDKRASRTSAFQLTGNPTERRVVTRMFSAEAQFPIAVWDFSWKIGEQVERFPELEYKIDRNQGAPASLWNNLYHALTTVNHELVGRIYDCDA